MCYIIHMNSSKNTEFLHYLVCNGYIGPLFLWGLLVCLQLQIFRPESFSFVAMGGGAKDPDVSDRLGKRDTLA